MTGLKMAAIVFATLLVFFVGKKYSLARWTGYRLNFVTVSTLVLAICVVITISLGAFLYWSKAAPDAGKITGGQSETFPDAEATGQETPTRRRGDGFLYGIHMVFDLLGGDYEEMRSAFPKHPVLTWLLCFLIPGTTVSTVIMSLIKVFPKFFFPRQEYLVFSQADENSILLAESMMYGGNNGTVRTDRKVIFLRREADQLSPEHSDRIRKIKARTYPYTEADLLRIHRGLGKKRLRFFFLSSNTELNFSRMKLFLEEAEEDTLFSESLLQRFKKGSQEESEKNGVFQQELYLLSETESAPLLIDHLRNHLCQTQKCRKSVFLHTDLRLLDRYRTVMYRLLQEKPLYEYADEKNIRVLVLGFGRVGKAFFRAAVSFCAMADYKTSFCIMDTNIDKQWHDLLLQYPECAKDIPVDRRGLDVESEKLLDALDQAIRYEKPFTYIVLSLGDDERNIKVASRMARHYRKRYWENKDTQLPMICVNLEDNIKSDYMSAFFEKLNPQNPAFVFGSDNHTFSEKMLMNRNLWAAARNLHRNLKSCDFTYWNEYERRSSIACTAHTSYHCRAADSYYKAQMHELYFDCLTEEQKETMVDAEHRRWMAYSRSEGMQSISVDIAKVIWGETGTHVDMDGRLTPCLVPTKELDGLYRAIYLKGKSTTQQEEMPPRRTFYERDRFVARNIYRIQECLNSHDDDDIP